MAAFKGYCDESGKETDQTEIIATCAAFVGPVDAWQSFEARWKAALDKNDIPYLHMKDLAGLRPPYDKWIDDPDAVATCIADMVEAINDSGLEGYGCGTFLDGLRRFNKERGQAIEAWSLNLYGTYVQFGYQHWEDDLQVVIDRIDRGHARVALAQEYFETDAFMQGLKWPVSTPLSPESEEVTSANCYGLQAADFLAWEMRRGIHNKRDWFKHVKPTVNYGLWEPSLLNWQAAQKGMTVTQENYLEVRERRSLAALLKRTKVHAPVFDYEQLTTMEKARGTRWRV